MNKRGNSNEARRAKQYEENKIGGAAPEGIFLKQAAVPHQKVHVKHKVD